PASTRLYPLSLHDALPILLGAQATAVIRNELLLLATAVLIMGLAVQMLRKPGDDIAVPRAKPRVWMYLLTGAVSGFLAGLLGVGDRKSTRLNSSHQIISYA